jgi:hypothetical protein
MLGEIADVDMCRLKALSIADSPFLFPSPPATPRCQACHTMNTEQVCAHGHCAPCVALGESRLLALSRLAHWLLSSPYRAPQ